MLVDLTSDALEKFLAISTKQEPLCSLSGSSRSDTAAETCAADSQQNISSSKKVTAVLILRDKMPCLDCVGFANPGKLYLAPFYIMLLLFIFCALPFLSSSQRVSIASVKHPCCLCLGEVNAGADSKSSF